MGLHESKKLPDHSEGSVGKGIGTQVQTLGPTWKEQSPTSCPLTLKHML